MKINFSQVYEGWRNNLFPPADIKPLIERTAAERIAICEGCEFHSKNHSTARLDDHCTYCGCTLSAKTRCLSCTCPKMKWVAVLDSRKKEEELKTAIQDGEQ